MTYAMGTNPEATSVASALMVVAMIDLLIKKDLLTRAEVGEALHNALQEAGSLGGNAIRAHAPEVVASVMKHVAGQR